VAFNDLALLKRRRSLLDRLRNTTGERLQAIWLRLGAYTDDQKAVWLSAASPIVQASQDHAVDLQIAYLETVLGETLTFDREQVIETASIDLLEPFIALATALSLGHAFTQAVESGSLRAEGIGKSAVTFAARAASTAAEPHVVGWTRVLDAAPCEWCQVVSIQRYHSAEAASFGHLNCHCDIDPIIGTRDPGRTLNHQLLAQLKESGAVARASESRQRRRERDRVAPR
jgi:hypothetical protein